MNNSNFQKNKKLYLKVVKNLMSLRPFCHTISAFTTVCFLIVLMLSKDYIVEFFNYLGFWSYIAVSLLAIGAAFLYESKLNKVIDSTGLIIAKGDSQSLSAGMAIIALPLVLIAGATSFVGANEIASQQGDKIIESEINSLDEKLERNSKAFSKDREQRENKIISERSKLRKSIISKYQFQLKSVPVQNKRQYYKHNESDWHFNKLQESNQEDSLKIISKMNSEIEDHDKKTSEILASLIDTHSESEVEQNKASAIYSKAANEKSKRKADRWAWFGGFFAYASILALLISVVASLCIHFISHKIGVDPYKLKKGSLSLSPTLAVKYLLNLSKSPIKAGSGTNIYSNDGVGEEHQRRIKELKDKAIRGAEVSNHHNDQIARQGTEQLLEAIEELKQFGVKTYWANEDKTEIRFND